MENEKSLFSLDINVLAKNHLLETSKWGRFLAITGFIGIGLILVFCSLILVNIDNMFPIDNSSDSASAREDNIIGLVFMMLLGVLYFFPCYFILKFSNKMKAALIASDGNSLNAAFKNLKVTFRYIGVLTIIFIVLLGLGLIEGLTTNL